MPSAFGNAASPGPECTAHDDLCEGDTDGEEYGVSVEAALESAQDYFGEDPDTCLALVTPCAEELELTVPALEKPSSLEFETSGRSSVSGGVERDSEGSSFWTQSARDYSSNIILNIFCI